MSSGDYECTNKLAELFSEATNRSIDDARRLIESTNTEEAGHSATDFRATITIAAPREGRRLCTAIQNVPDSTNSKAYELAIEAALRYVFQGQLSGWRRQNIQTDLMRPDLIAKIHYDADSFWQELVRDFSTRFVCFDAKNYAKPVDQSQIYSTEKYLHREARRGTAIIVSRKGVDPGAERAMHGALRESGRIITWLTDDEICSMLDAKDSGSEVNEILSERIDDMLMRISR